MNVIKKIYITLKTSVIETFKLTKTFIKEDEQTRLLKFNEFISNKQVIIGLCVIISLLFLIMLNILSQLISNFGQVIKGKFNYLQIFVPNFKATPVFIIGLIILFVCLVVLVYKIKVNFKDLNVGQKGKSRFATIEEIQNTFLEINEKDTPYKGNGGFPVSRYRDKLYVCQEIMNRIIVTMTRGGKGEVFVIPSMDTYSRADQKQSFIVMDLKMELARAATKKLLERGYNVKLVNLIDTEHSIGFNPLQIILDFYLKGDYANAEEATKTLAQAIVGSNTQDPYWDDAAISLLSAVIFAHLEDLVPIKDFEKINLYSVALFVTTLGSMKDEKKKEDYLDKYFMSRSIYSKSRMKFATIKFSPDKTRASILSVLIKNLDIFMYEDIAKITSYNTIDLLDLGFNEDKPTAVFVAVSAATRAYDMLATIFIAQAFYANLGHATKTNKNKLKRPIKVIADEFCNYPELLHLETMISIAVGSGWTFDFYVQEFEQLHTKYSPEITKTIIGNCGTKVYLYSSSDDTRAAFVKDLGSKTIKNVSRSGERLSLSKSITENYEDKSLLSEAALSRFKIGECIVLPLMARRDLQEEKIIPRPIHNHDETEFKLRYEYIPEWDPMADIDYEKIGAVTRKIYLKDIVYIPEIEGVAPIDIDGTKKRDGVITKREEREVKEMDNKTKQLLTLKINPIQFSMLQKILEDSSINIDKNITLTEARAIIMSAYRNGDIATEDYAQLMKMLD